MNVVSLVLDLPMALTATGVAVSLIGTAVTLRLARRQARPVVKIDVDQKQIDVTGEQYVVSVGKTPAGVPSKPAQLVLPGEAKLLAELDEVLAALTPVDRHVLTALRAAPKSGV